MSQEGAEADQGDEIKVVENKGCNEGGNESLEDIKEKGDDSQSLPSTAHHIGSTNVAAAYLPGIRRAGYLGEDETARDRSQKIPKDH